MLPEQQQRILGYFLEEARDHLNTIEQGLLNLQGTLNDQEMLKEVFRAAHSIKGGAAMLNLTSIQNTAHRLEDAFKILQSHPVQVDQKLESLFLGVSDTLKMLLENLSAPFALSPETATTLMSDTEPVFQMLNQHLESLVQQPEKKAASIPQHQPTPQRLSREQFQTQVIEILGEMLLLFKQAPTSITRQQLQEYCQQLVKLGAGGNLFNWYNLCEAASSAIANPHNTYLTLAKILIADIKQAQELVIQGREIEIVISQQLEDLLSRPEDIESTQITPQLPVELEILPQRTTTTSNFEETLLTHNHTDTYGPEVGFTELNTLADLFESETFELEDSWQQEGIPDTVITEDSDTDADNDLAEILAFDTETEEPELQSTAADLTQLFSDNFLGKEDLEPQEPDKSDDIEDLIELDSEFIDPQQISFENLFAETVPPQINSAPEISEDDITNFWNQADETQEYQFADGAKELEESLFAATIPPEAQKPIISTSSSLNLQDLNPTFNQTEQSTFEDNLFADLVETKEPQLLEIHSFAQEPEAVDFMPEFTNTAKIFAELEIDLFATSEHSQQPGEEETAINSTNTEENITDSEFAQLEALLETIQPAPPPHTEKEFAALETLLSIDQPTVVAPEIQPVPSPPPSPIVAPVIKDEFQELEDLLAEANETISSPVKPTIGKLSRPANRRGAKFFEETMKVPVKQLDDMSNLVGELVVNRNTLEQDHERLRQSLDNLLIQVQQLSDVGARMQELYERSLLEASLLASRKTRDTDLNAERGFSELEMDRFTPFHTLSQEMIERIVRVRESASDIDFVTEGTERIARQFRQVTNQLQEGLTRARMLPFAQKVIDPIRLGVRNNAIKCGKQVELVIEGGNTLIDKMILDRLTSPLTHMLNNAIIHGIETPEERITRGKPPVGVITIQAFHQGNQTVISVSDDGAGINLEQIRAKALAMGMITSEQSRSMSRQEIYDLLFQSGFTIKDKADEFAGRGVGMDVVRSEISEIRGTVSTDSTPGKGTTFTIRLPLTLSICKSLCCVSDRARIAFPMDSVEDTLDIPVKNIQQNPDGQSFIFWRDTVLPFRPLKELLTFNRQISRGSVYGGTRDDDMVSVVVVRSATTLVALQIDQVLNEQEIVIKQFEGPAPKPIGVAGATVLGDGRIMPIADVLEIIDIFQGRMAKQIGGTSWQQPAPPTVAETTEVKIDPTVLIVDDSITVRELLSLTFNKAGYRVEQARDGQEAWDKLRSGLPCDIVFCDIEMPRCDGLELLSRIQKDANLKKLPIAMLTSRGADKHRQMAVQLGASGYFTKPYLEEALLEAASRMLKGEKLATAI